MKNGVIFLTLINVCFIQKLIKQGIIFVLSPYLFCYSPTQCRSRNSITYTRDMFLKKVVDPEKEERQRKKDKKK